MVLPNQATAAPSAQDEAKVDTTTPVMDSRSPHTQNVPSLAQLRSGPAMQSGSNQYSESDMLRQQMSQISQRVSVSGDMIQFFNKFQAIFVRAGCPSFA